MTLVPRGPGTHEEARPISTPHPAADGRPWCVEHDPAGVCLGDLHELPGGGAAWLEGASDGARRGGTSGGSAAVVVVLARPDARRSPRFTAREAREIAAALTALADEIEASERPHR